MSMTAGFSPDDPSRATWEKVAAEHSDFVDLLLERRLSLEPGKNFLYSNISAHLVAAVLAAAEERADGDHPRTVLDYAQAKLFDPLGIATRPAFSGVLIDPYSAAFAKSGFGWGTDPNGIEVGGYGLRLRAPDMVELGELYRHDGVWEGTQIVPAAWIQLATTPSDLTPEYGLLWWVGGEGEQQTFAAQGAGGQRIFVLPKSRAVVVILASTHVDSQVANDDLSRMINEVLAPVLQ